MELGVVELADNEVELLSIFAYAGYTNKLDTIPVKVGLKIEVKEDVLKLLMENDYIQNNFKLNVIRLNSSWWSVYFDEIGSLLESRCKNEGFTNNQK